MKNSFDVLVIGTGTAGYTAAYELQSAGKKVAIVDYQPYGGVCAMKGCQPKKYFVAAAESLEHIKNLQGLGIDAKGAKIHWQELLANKIAFTSRVPERTKKAFNDAGMLTLEGKACFMDEHTVCIENSYYYAEQFVIATGAEPSVLEIEGRELLKTSDDFLSLEQLPQSIVFIGAGYIAFEFAHVAAQAGCNVTIVHHNDKPLARFEQSLVEELLKRSREMGINIITNFAVKKVEPLLNMYSISNDKGESILAQLVFNTAGRSPVLKELRLDNAKIEHDKRGIEVNAYMQTSQKHIFAIGDVAKSIQLATVADREALVAARNILEPESMQMNYEVVPSALFTLPALASVGMQEEDAKKASKNFRVNAGSMTAWPSSKRIGQKHANYKVLIEEESERILGAHLLCYNSAEMINIFALAIQAKLTTKDLKAMLWAYPTSISDIKYMLG